MDQNEEQVQQESLQHNSGLILHISKQRPVANEQAQLPEDVSAHGVSES